MRSSVHAINLIARLFHLLLTRFRFPPARSPSTACAAALNSSGCPHGPGVRGCRKCLGKNCPLCSPKQKPGDCSEANMAQWCRAKSDDESAPPPPMMLRRSGFQRG